MTSSSGARSRLQNHTEPPEKAVEAVIDTFRYGMKKGHWSLFGVPLERLARRAVQVALSSEYVVTRDRMDEAVADERRKAERHLHRACAAEVALDRAKIAIAKITEIQDLILGSDHLGLLTNRDQAILDLCKKAIQIAEKKTEQTIGERYEF